jgi:hypothetical protein
MLISSLLFSQQALAQATDLLQPAIPEAAGIPDGAVQLDLDRLLTSDRVLENELSDAVWTVEAGSGRRFLQLPLQLHAADADYTLSRPPIELLSSRMMVWEVPDSSDATDNRRGAQPNDDALPPDTDFSDLQALLDHDVAGDIEGSSGLTQDASIEEAEQSIPENAPRIARDIVVKSNGRVSWEMDRAVPGEVNTGSEPYMLKLRRDRLRELEPERPERLTRSSNESTREFDQRRRESAATYREASAEYRDLQESLRQLPETFHAPIPPIVWAVFEIPASTGRIAVADPTLGRWEIDLRDFEALRAIASGESADVYGSTLRNLSAQNHPWSRELLTRAIIEGGTLQNLTANSPLASAVQAVLQSDHLASRNRMAMAITRLSPPNPAASRVLRSAASASGDPAMQLAALRASLRDATNASSTSSRSTADSNQLTAAARAANDLLHQPAELSPSPVSILSELLEQTRSARNEPDPLIRGVEFKDLPQDRLSAAIAAVIAAVDTDPLVASGWIDDQLLGSNDAATVRATLESLALADAPSHIVKPIAHLLQDLTLGRPPADQPTTDLTLGQGIPLDSANHSMFLVLNSGDPEIRSLGWQVLRHFELPAASTSRGSTPTPEDEDPLAMIVDAGLGQSPTPASLVLFLDRQPDKAPATEALIRVVIEGDAAASLRAARSLIGSERSIETPVVALSLEDRQKFADQVLLAAGLGKQPVSGLMQDPADVAAKWFTGEIVDVGVPDPDQWADAYPDERALLQLISASNPQAAAGAVAALVAAAGGDVPTQWAMIDSAQPMIGADLAAVTDAWSQTKRSIYALELAEAAGEYRLALITSENTSDAAGDPAAGSIRERHVLGIVELVGDGDTIRFANGVPALTVPNEYLAIRIEEPVQLKNLDMPDELKALPIEQAQGPLDLKPDGNGGWRGGLDLPEAGRFELLMEPYSGS